METFEVKKYVPLDVIIAQGLLQGFGGLGCDTWEPRGGLGRRCWRWDREYFMESFVQNPMLSHIGSSCGSASDVVGKTMQGEG